MQVFKMILKIIYKFGIEVKGAKLEALWSKCHKIQSITFILNKWNNFHSTFYKICAHLKLENCGKIHGFNKEVVPHYIKLHLKNHFLNHKMWDKLDQLESKHTFKVWNSNSNHIWNDYLGVPLMARCWRYGQFSLLPMHSKDGKNL